MRTGMRDMNGKHTQQKKIIKKFKTDHVKKINNIINQKIRGRNFNYL